MSFCSSPWVNNAGKPFTINVLPPGLKNLLIIMVLVSFAQVALPKTGFDVETLYLFYPDSENFRIWQLITHIFCHGGIGHLLFNGLALFSFGAIVEYRLGVSRFLQLFFISALGAVLVHFSQMAYTLFTHTETIFPNYARTQRVKFRFYRKIIGKRLIWQVKKATGI